jgi:hypothetical protein
MSIWLGLVRSANAAITLSICLWLCTRSARKTSIVGDDSVSFDDDIPALLLLPEDDELDLACGGGALTGRLSEPQPATIHPTSNKQQEYARREFRRAVLVRVMTDLLQLGKDCV